MTEQATRQPLVSAIVPTYNAARYVTECLDSIAAQKGGISMETIVVDDGSTDDTREKVRAFGAVRLIEQANAGPSAARNRGISEATGEYVAFLDSDDLWTEDKLAVQMEIARSHPQVAMVIGDCQRFNENGPIERPFFMEAGIDETFWGHPVLVEDPYYKLFRSNYVPTGSVLLRKRCLEKTGLFDEKKRFVEDLDLWFRVAFHFPVAYTRHLCQLKRQHAECVSNDAEAMTLAHVQVLDEQRRLHGDLIESHGIRLQPRFCLEYCLLGYRSEREGRMTDARRWYLKGLRAYPSLRPAYYYMRSLVAGRPAETP